MGMYWGMVVVVVVRGRGRLTKWRCIYLALDGLLLLGITTATAAAITRRYRTA
jgi:hypothetical protein